MTTFGPLFQAGGQERLAGLIEDTEADIRDYCLPRDHFAYAFGYNTDRLELSDVPKTWDELLDPKFKNQVAIQSSGFPLGGLGIANGWGEERTVQLARDLKANGVIIASGGSNGVQQAVSSGEALVGIAGYRGWMTDREREAPVDLRFPDDVIPYFTSNMCPANGDHPEMAALFTAWFAVEGRYALRDYPVFFGSLNDTSGSLGNQLVAQGVDRSKFVTFTTVEEGEARTRIRLASVAAWAE
jgi:ABC-type thiamine transport system substrate-binding protein